MPMELTTFSVETAEDSLHEEGFVDLQDSEVGGYVSEIEQKGFQYLSPHGLDFCQQCVLEDVRIRSILETLFEKCSLGHWLRYKELPGHIECFRKGGPEAGRRVVLVQLWARGSRVEYYRGSHLCVLPTTKGERSLHDISRMALDEAACKPNELKFPDGGL
ncbi:hypothetical protein ColLi_13286 [Colletotrichum liriopes]|uniref:Uncharacterized protein n=1 Tax=Colletotrichum liriopes TaxID=708192 RepID=A0AA37M0H4_9PEZI|nr:hypothetical protein ColLi_13286 [Colletotrichum liriopes]